VKSFIDDLKELNVKIKVIERSIGHELELINELEAARANLEKSKSNEVRDILNQLEANKRRVRDLEYEEQLFKNKKKELETVYKQERIAKLSENVKMLIEKRDKIKNQIIPHLEEKMERLKSKITEMDTEILRLKGKIQFLEEK
jgi:hypothetical protein